MVRTEDFDQTSLSTIIVRPAISIFLYRVDYNKTMRAAWAGVTNQGPAAASAARFAFPVDAVGRERGKTLLKG